MATEDKQGAAAPAEDAAAPKGKKKKLVLVVLVLALAGGAYKFVLAPSPPAAAEEPAAPAPPVPGEVVSLDPITLNLADGRFLKVGIALQLVEGVPVPADDAIAGYAAPALDEAISLLGAMSYTELVAPGARDAAKAALSERVAARYLDEDDPEAVSDVLGVYFTELVMQ